MMNENAFKMLTDLMEHELRKDENDKFILRLTLSNGLNKEIEWNNTFGTSSDCLLFTEGDAIGAILYDSILGVMMEKI